MLREPDRRPGHILSARIGRHDQHDIAKIGLTTVVVRQGAVIHDLQQQVEDVRVCLLDFVEQHDAVWVLGDGFGQQATLIKADVSGRCADQSRDGMSLHVLRHVIAQQLDTHDHRQLATDLGLTYARGPGKQERTDGFLAGLQPGPRQLDG